MRQSTIPSQYYIQPPSVPDFVYKISIRAWYDLMYWSYAEYKEREKNSIQKGYYREVIEVEREYSPLRILAEMQGFRRLCSIMPSRIWKMFERREKDYLTRCYELRDHLFR